MKKASILFMMLVLVMLAGCSSNDDSDNASNLSGDHFNFVVNGTEIPLNTVNQFAFNYGMIGKQGDMFSVYISSGINSSNESGLAQVFEIKFDTQGRLISADWDAFGGGPRYRNYKNFAPNYFDVNIVSVDEANHRVKLNFSGTLYRDWTDMNSESADISGDLDMTYQGGDGPLPEITYNSVPQYCEANFNGLPWHAYHEYDYGKFTSIDPYRIEIFFAQDAGEGTFGFDPDAAANCIRISKFNTQTLTYDYYQTTGTVSCTHKEFHGFTDYSFIGTFSLTAVNPNNPSDIIQISDGTFRSYQIY